ncbi:unnamed protein product [Didymodactylos carnosus]|uniref:No apical meristem-associated C-terminal domain-containing protein n=1 Tax=Didymodactylos carnosus TaxID=1234261 RepID=A0A814USY6_9BILA|nr:unnamed protein product [Didymodactylos carnosus]CAF1252927.1 unnamed protein product [Didymodactylos carnosus]CAF3945955.1 unnamed protein product [Didymodactylos carnosus]CAF4060016.1 unnamed protein product [Didymodactylos carnosus]
MKKTGGGPPPRRSDAVEEKVVDIIDGDFDDDCFQMQTTTTTPKTPLPHEKKTHSIGACLMQLEDHSTKQKMKREDEYKRLMSMQEKKLILKTEEVEAAKTTAHAMGQLIELQKIQLSVRCEQVKISSRLYEIRLKTTNPDYDMKEDQTLNQTVLNLIVPIDT